MSLPSLPAVSESAFARAFGPTKRRAVDQVAPVSAKRFRGSMSDHIPDRVLAEFRPSLPFDDRYPKIDGKYVENKPLLDSFVANFGRDALLYNDGDQRYGAVRPKRQRPRVKGKGALARIADEILPVAKKFVQDKVLSSLWNRHFKLDDDRPPNSGVTIEDVSDQYPSRPPLAIEPSREVYSRSMPDFRPDFFEPVSSRTRSKNKLAVNPTVSGHGYYRLFNNNPNETQYALNTAWRPSDMSRPWKERPPAGRTLVFEKGGKFYGGNDFFDYDEEEDDFAKCLRKQGWKGDSKPGYIDRGLLTAGKLYSSGRPNNAMRWAALDPSNIENDDYTYARQWLRKYNDEVLEEGPIDPTYGQKATSYVLDKLPELALTAAKSLF